MFDGNRFFPDTGMPMRKMACMSSPFALADPVPLTLASFRAKSLILRTRCWCTELALAGGVVGRSQGRRWPRLATAGQWDEDLEFLHVPGRRGAALGAQAAMDAHVLVLDHHAPGLRQGSRDVEVLGSVGRRHRQAGPQGVLVRVRRDGQAVDRADVDAGIALDAQLVAEHRLHIAVQATLDLAGGLLRIEAQLDFQAQLLEALREVD